MTEGGKTRATKKTTVTTTTATAVPVGSADAGAGAEEVTVPRRLIISLVVIDAVALFFSVFIFMYPPLGIIGMLCAIAAWILAFVIHVHCQDADAEFRGSTDTFMLVHIAFAACYIISFALAWTALAFGGFGTPMGITSLIFMVCSIAFLITGLVLASILLCTSKIIAIR